MTFRIGKPKNNDLLSIVLIGLDTDKNIEQIEPVVRVNLNIINAYYLENNILALKKYLGDDDLLGIRQIKYSDFEKINFKGINLFDSYDYLISR